MAKGQQRGNREAKKPKKEKEKIIAAAPNRSFVAVEEMKLRAVSVTVRK